MKVIAYKDNQRTKGAQVHIDWFSQVGGLPIGADDGYTDDRGEVEFFQPVNLFGAYGEGRATSGVSRGEFNVRLDAFGNSPDVQVHMYSAPGQIVGDWTKAFTGKAWIWLLGLAALLVAIGYGTGSLAKLLGRR